jgi:predicted nucleic acid-binding protein
VIAILADTSALVSLEIKHLVALASEVVHFSISTGIGEELKEIAKFEDVHGRSAKDVLELIDKGIIEVKSVNARKEHTKNIDMGEAEILTLGESGKYDYIITDDVQAMPYMKSVARVKILTSVFVIRLLYDLKLLSRHEALDSIKEISTSRDWYGGILETIAYKYFDDISDSKNLKERK